MSADFEQARCRLDRCPEHGAAVEMSSASHGTRRAVGCRLITLTASAGRHRSIMGSLEAHVRTRFSLARSSH